MADVSVSEWLARYVKGEAADQHQVLLDRFIRQKVDEAVAKRKSSAVLSMPTPEKRIEIFRELFASWERGELTDQEGEVATLLGDLVKLSAPASAEATPDETMGERLREISKENEQVILELARAHEWRFHLEAHAREAQGVLRQMIDRAQAPRREELEGLLQTLQAGIWWAPK